MSVFDELETQYNEIEEWYSSLQFQTVRRGCATEATEYQKRRKINDQAYFLFMFTRLEDRIREESAKLIRREKGSISSWKQRAPWDILDSQLEKRKKTQFHQGLNFKTCLALLTEKGASDFNLVLCYYEERNSIAHGGNFTKPISVPTVASELKRLYEVLKA